MPKQVSRDQYQMQPRRFLYCFGYADPEEIAWCSENGHVELGESSCMCFVVANTELQAIETGQEIAKAFVQSSFGESTYTWKASDFASWIENDPNVIDWGVSNQVPEFDATTSANIGKFATQLLEWDRPSNI